MDTQNEDRLFQVGPATEDSKISFNFISMANKAIL